LLLKYCGFKPDQLRGFTELNIFIVAVWMQQFHRHFSSNRRQ